MSDLIAIAYPDKATAERVASRLYEASKGKLVDLDDMVVVEHKDNGKIKLHQGSLAAGGAMGGAAWGGLIGLLFFVPLFGMAIGAASGAAAGAVSDAGVDDKFMKDLGAQLEPGSVALVALVRNANLDKLLADVKEPGTIIHSSLGGDSEQLIREALEGAGQKA